MTAPLINPRSEQAQDLVSRLEYQLIVNRTLLASTRPAGSRPDGLLSRTEMEEMERAYTMGLSAAGFAARLIARDKTPTDTEILERLIARNCLGAVRKYDTWCYGGERYPDARAALAAFMRATA